MFSKTILVHLCAISFAVAYPITTPTQSNLDPMDVEGDQKIAPAGPSTVVRVSLASQVDLGNQATTQTKGKKRSREKEENDTPLSQEGHTTSKRHKNLCFQTYPGDQPMDVETTPLSTIVTLAKPNYDGTLLALPKELLDHIFGYLDPKNRLAVVLTCRLFNEVMQARCKSECQPRQQLGILRPGQQVKLLSWLLTWKEQVYGNFPHLEDFHNTLQVYKAPLVDPQILRHCSYQGPKLLIDKQAFWESYNNSTDNEEIQNRLANYLNGLVKHALAGNWQYVAYYLNAVDFPERTSGFLLYLESYSRIIGGDLVAKILTYFTPQIPQSQYIFAGYLRRKTQSSLARRFMKLAADQGYVEAQYHFAFMLKTGEGGDQDPIEMRHYIQLSAMQGHRPSLYTYAYCLYNGIGGDKDLPEARHYYRLAADQGLASAQRNLAIMLNNGIGGNIDLTEARRYFKLAADHGEVLAQYNYAAMLYDAKGGDRDLPEARRYYKLAADQGGKTSQYNYAVMLYNAEGGDRDLPEARRYYKLAAEQGHASAQYNYGLMLYGAKGGDRDLPEARRYYKLAAEQGHAYAQSHYAIMLERGRGGDIDLPQARRYYKLAADNGHAMAQYNLAMMLKNGIGGSADYDEARPYFKLAADQGLASAQRNLAIMLRNGNGGNIDLTEARRYFKLSADQGDITAQKSYAIMLNNGLGGDIDLTETRRYLKLAAGQGDDFAQLNYGYMLYNGEGGEKDLAQARYFLQLAADQGNADALKLLDELNFEPES